MSLLRPVLLVVSLGMHSMIAGVVLGLTSSQSRVYELWLVIASHKWAAAMGVGASYGGRTKKGLWTGVLLVGIFSATTPVGVVLGLCLDGVSHLVSAVLTSLGVGIFIFVGMEQVLEELKPTEGRCRKCIALGAGVLLIGGSCLLL